MMGFAALLLGIAGWIVMCIPDCATAAIVPALLGTGLGSAELLRCRRRKKPVRLAAAAVLVSLSALAAALFSSADAVHRAPEPGSPPPGKEKPETPAPPEEEPEPPPVKTPVETEEPPAVPPPEKKPEPPPEKKPEPPPVKTPEPRPVVPPAAPPAVSL